MDPVSGWFFSYIASKLFDSAIGRYNEWRKQRKLTIDVSRFNVSGERFRQTTPTVLLGRSDHNLDIFPHEEGFSKSILAAVNRLILAEMSEFMQNGQASKALAYVKKHIQAIEDALKEDTGPENRYEEALRSYRQTLLFAAASAASWQGDIESGKVFWWRAHNLGPIDSKWHKQAVITLFNVGLKDELRHFMKEMNQESEAYQKFAIPSLVYLEKNWSKVDELLSNAQNIDQILQRVQARIQIMDAKDTEAVRLTANLLDHTDHDTAFPIINLIRAQLTLDLLKLVIRGYTPLDYNRRPLISSVVERIDLALNTIPPHSLLQAQILCCVSMAAGLLRDDMLKEKFDQRVKDLPESIRSSIFFSYDAELSPEKIDALLAEGQITLLQSAILKVEIYQTLGQTDQVKRELYGALYATPDKSDRALVLGLLTQTLRQENQVEKAQRLIDEIPLHAVDQWLLQVENLPVGKIPTDLINESEAFPLDIDVIQYLAQFTLSKAKFTSPENTQLDESDLKHAKDAVRWSTHLVEILPSGSSYLHHAWALYAARSYTELLTAIRDLDPIHAEQAAEFEAWALIGLGQKNEAINHFISASKAYPELNQFVINAAHYLLVENRPEEAENLLSPYITVDSQDPDVLFIYACSIRNQAPTSQDHASRAFDLLKRAYKLQPDSNIAQVAWYAAKAAGRVAEADHLFNAMIPEMPVKVIETDKDFAHVMEIASKNHGVRIEWGREYLAKMFQEGRKRSEVLEKLLYGHALSYVDFLRHSGQSWELWAYWTQRFEQRDDREQTSLGEFSILSDWPSLRPRYDQDRVSLFLDQSAILTLGVLGPKITEQILSAIGKCYVPLGIMEELSHDMNRIRGQLLTENPTPYHKSVRFFFQRSDGVITYSRELEANAPDEPNLGPLRIDLGTAIQYDALYVTDLDTSIDWPEIAHQRRISSAALLASLNTDGEVTTDEAMDAAKKYPDIFERWDTTTPRPIPEAIVFDENSILNWIESGLANVLGNRIKIGPWAWRCISEKFKRLESLELAFDRLKDTRRVFQSALDEKILVEIEADVNSESLKDLHDLPNENASHITNFWSGALKSLQMAYSHNLQLWADDRFYPLLLSFGGPKNMGDEVNIIYNSFSAWAEETPPISTSELLEQLSSSEGLSSIVAQNATRKLYSKGYRMVSPCLLLSHALRQYPVPVSNQLTQPFRKLTSTITEIPHYHMGTFNEFYGNRDGFIRLGSMEVSKRLIVEVWKATNLTNDQRYLLADAFLKAVECVFEGEHFSDGSFQDGLTSLSFWQGIAYALKMMPVENEADLESCFTALEWLGRAAASRSYQRKEILRILEDNVLDSLKHAFKAFEGNIDKNSLHQIISTLVIRALVPLSNPSFNDILDPLIRRTVSVLAKFSGGGRIAMNYYNSDGGGIRLKISEEEIEKAATEILIRLSSGDSKYSRFILGIDMIFCYTRPAPEELADKGFHSDEKISMNVKCSLFTLLWDAPPDLCETIIGILIHYLSIIDPALAYQILLLEDDLIRGDPETMQQAQDTLAIELLRSGYIDLQRDLVHAVQRLNQYEPHALMQFIGWVGENEAQALINHSLTSKIWRIGSLLIPQTHLFARALLTNQFDDGNFVIECVDQLINVSNDESGNNDDISTLSEWLEDKVLTAENADDPFVAAWSLRVILLTLTKIKEDTQLNINGNLIKISDWVRNYIMTSLFPDIEDPSRIEQKMIDRRNLASSALLLAIFVCSGHKHLEFYRQVDDSTAIFLEQIWILSNKFHTSLIGFYGGVSNAAEIAANTAQEIELEISDNPIIDAFDPSAFGTGGEDVGVALTLTAMLKVVKQIPDKNLHSAWWSNATRNLVEQLSDLPTDARLPINEEFPNRFGLVAPLRIRLIAQELTKSLSH